MSATTQRARAAAFAVGIVLAAAPALSGCGEEQEPVLGASQRPATIWAVGDGADGGEDARAVAALVDPEETDRFLYLGDVYETGTAEEFERHYNAVYGALDPIAVPTVGNHEIANRRQGYDPYWAARGDEDPTGPMELVVGGWELLRLSYSGEPGYPPKRAQFEWLRRAVREPGTCRLAFWHVPRYSAGIQHGDNRVAEPFWELLEGRATLVLHGHEHNYQRFRPIRGIVQVIAGAGGHELYPVDATDPRLAASDDRHYGALRVDLEPGLARLSFVNADGETLDQEELRCRPVTP